MNVSSPDFLFVRLYSESDWPIAHTACCAHGSQCCRQYRDGELNHRLPKVFVFHDVVVFSLTLLFALWMCRQLTASRYAVYTHPFRLLTGIKIAVSWHIFLQREENRESFPYKSANGHFAV